VTDKVFGLSLLSGSRCNLHLYTLWVIVTVRRILNSVDSVVNVLTGFRVMCSLSLTLTIAATIFSRALLGYQNTSSRICSCLYRCCYLHWLRHGEVVEEEKVIFRFRGVYRLARTVQSLSRTTPIGPYQSKYITVGQKASLLLKKWRVSDTCE